MFESAQEKAQYLNRFFDGGGLHSLSFHGYSSADDIDSQRWSCSISGLHALKDGIERHPSGSGKTPVDAVNNMWDELSKYKDYRRIVNKCASKPFIYEDVVTYLTFDPEFGFRLR